MEVALSPPQVLGRRRRVRPVCGGFTHHLLPSTPRSTQSSYARISPNNWDFLRVFLSPTGQEAATEVGLV